MLIEWNKSKEKGSNVFDQLINSFIRVLVTDLRSVRQGDYMVYVQGNTCRDDSPPYTAEAPCCRLYDLDKSPAHSIPMKKVFIIIPFHPPEWERFSTSRKTTDFERVKIHVVLHVIEPRMLPNVSRCRTLSGVNLHKIIKNHRPPDRCSEAQPK